MRMRILIILLSLVSALPLLAIECGDPGLNLPGSGNPVFTPKWTPDGTRILFPTSRWIYTIDTMGIHLQSISEPPSGDADYLYADFSPDVSPDGSRVVFATSRHGSGLFSRSIRNLDIGTSALDGTNHRQLTDTEFMEANPTWSPDGRRIAFINSDLRTLHTMATDGSDVRDITPLGLSVVNSPPVWSPDGNRIAFRTYGNEPLAEGYREEALYTIATDGSDPRLVSQSNGQPAWSLDGTRIAFVVPHETLEMLYMARWDGSDIQKVFTSSRLRYSNTSNLSWAPDGSEIRFTARSRRTIDGIRRRVDGIHAVKADGSEHRHLADVGRVTDLRQLPLIAWSPDDSRIAARIVDDNSPTGVVLHTIATDGSDMRVLVRSGGGILVAENSGWQDVPGASVCSEGFVVPDPKENPGLVQDCETLLSLRIALAGEDTILGWDEEIPMVDWPGVFLTGSPTRVYHLTVEDANGVIPPELGQLAGLRVLRLTTKGLQGSIPPELGNLVNLQELTLERNLLSGEIPPELGNLVNLETLSLSVNQLTGEIPSELGNLANLEWLLLENNRLSGSIPSELGSLVKLGALRLNSNQLFGSIPPELGRLVNLRSLILDHNQLTGSIPPALADIPNLNYVDISSNRLSGCIPRGLYISSYQHDGLQPC